ncbi:MAG TPA: response regulator transcription factor [Acidimicrobiales bacterium]|nr:response regulator transcription factor [Acidimicrobiales bacterium]
MERSPARGGREPPDSTGNDRPVRVLLVSAEELILEGLRSMLDPDVERVEVVGCVPTPEDAPLARTRFDADIVLSNTEGRGTDGLASAAKMVEECRPSRVVIFTDDADERRLFEALRHGISGYLLKSLSGPQLADYLVRAREGEVVLDPAMAAKVAVRAARLGDGRGWPGSDIGLSHRESTVLTHLADGQSNRQISESLVVGSETVKTHLRSIYRKMGVSDRAQAVATALRQGMLN